MATQMLPRPGTTTSKVDRLIAGLAPLLERIEAVGGGERRAWILTYDRDTVVVARHQPMTDRLIFATGIAPVPLDGRLEFYEALLVDNDQWHESGGVWVGIDEALGMVSQIGAFRVTGLNVARLQDAFASYLGRVLAWREIVTEGAGGTTATTGRRQDLRAAPACA